MPPIAQLIWTVVAISATFGGVAAIFLIYVSGQIRSYIKSLNDPQQSIYMVQWSICLNKMHQWIASISLGFFIGNIPIVSIFYINELLDESTLLMVSLGTLFCGIFCIVLSMIIMIRSDYLLTRAFLTVTKK